MMNMMMVPLESLNPTINFASTINRLSPDSNGMEAKYADIKRMQFQVNSSIIFPRERENMCRLIGMWKEVSPLSLKSASMFKAQHRASRHGYQKDNQVVINQVDVVANPLNTPQPDYRT